MEKVRAALLASGSGDRRAWFACALSLAWPDGHTETVEGQVHGEAVWPPRGDRGFCYDPMRSEEHTSELQSLMRISYAVFCLKKKNRKETKQQKHNRIMKKNTRDSVKE